MIGMNRRSSDALRRRGSVALCFERNWTRNNKQIKWEMMLKAIQNITGTWKRTPSVKEKKMKKRFKHFSSDVSHQAQCYQSQLLKYHNFLCCKKTEIFTHAKWNIEGITIFNRISERKKYSNFSLKHEINQNFNGCAMCVLCRTYWKSYRELNSIRVEVFFLTALYPIYAVCT